MRRSGGKELRRVTLIGSCFSGFLKRPLQALAASHKYPAMGPLEFQTHTIWQRIDSIVDIINGNIPDRALVQFYLDNGHWELDRPLGIKISHAIRDSRWFANAILDENLKAIHLVNDTPDLLIFDSLSDWRHPLYRHRRHDWKCFLGKILFDRKDIEERFLKDFDFIKLLDLNDINRCIKSIMGFFKARNKDLKTVYIHFPATPGYLDYKWVARAEELQRTVALLKNEFDKSAFHQLIIPKDRVKPLTDPAHPNYSKDVWNHFYEEVYDYCAESIFEWVENTERKVLVPFEEGA